MTPSQEAALVALCRCGIHTELNEVTGPAMVRTWRLRPSPDRGFETVEVPRDEWEALQATPLVEVEYGPHVRRTATTPRGNLEAARIVAKTLRHALLVDLWKLSRRRILEHPDLMTPHGPVQAFRAEVLKHLGLAVVPGTCGHEVTFLGTLVLHLTVGKRLPYDHGWRLYVEAERATTYPKRTMDAPRRRRPRQRAAG